MRYVNQLSEASRNYRKENGLSPAQLAARLGLSPQAIWQLEKGTVHPSLSTLRLVAALFGWTAEDVGTLILELPDDTTAFYVPDRRSTAVGQETEQAAVD